jgi:hypothetical protein
VPTISLAVVCNTHHFDRGLSESETTSCACQAVRFSTACCKLSEASSATLHIFLFNCSIVGVVAKELSPIPSVALSACPCFHVMRFGRHWRIRRPWSLLLCMGWLRKVHGTLAYCSSFLWRMCLRAVVVVVVLRRRLPTLHCLACARFSGKIILSAYIARNW